MRGRLRGPGTPSKQSADPGRRPDPRLARFLRGLAIGALVGAAIAGSRVWRRRDRPEGPRPTG